MVLIMLVLTTYLFIIIIIGLCSLILNIIYCFLLQIGKAISVVNLEFVLEGDIEFAGCDFIIVKIILIYILKKVVQGIGVIKVI